MFSRIHTTTWKFDGGKYTNLNAYSKKGDNFRPDTLLVLRVQLRDAGYLDVAGNPVPETHFTGTGRAMIFHDGRMVACRWHKKLDSSIGLNTKAGELRLPPGHTWIKRAGHRRGRVCHQVTLMLDIAPVRLAFQQLDCDGGVPRR